MGRTSQLYHNSTSTQKSTYQHKSAAVDEEHGKVTYLHTTQGRRKAIEAKQRGFLQGIHGVCIYKRIEEFSTIGTFVPAVHGHPPRAWWKMQSLIARTG